MNQELVNYLQQQLRNSDERLKRFTHAPDGKSYPKRFLYKKLHRYIQDFLDKKSSNRMVIIPGFRGVGKTTLMAQVSVEYKNKVDHHLFLSIEDVNDLFNVGIAEIISAYETILGDDISSIPYSILICLDEIQSDPKWAITLKSLFEKTTNIFFCCSGSSAVILQTTPNLARRAVFEKMTPMCFTEYEMIKNNIYPPCLKNKILEATYFSKDAQEVFDNLFVLQSEVNQYWSRIKRTDIRHYLAYGTLPFSFMMPNEAAVYDAILLLLEKIIKIDLPTLGHFDTNTLGAVKRILFAIAENDVTSLSMLEQTFHINRLTIANVLEALEKAELLIRIPAYGSNMTVAKKPSKYLFMAPAIRMAFFYFTGQDSTYLTRQGKLLEDSIGSHLYREFIVKGVGAIRYDCAEGGADFILQILNNKQIIIEVGTGEKNKKQVIKTMKKINSDYNLIFSKSELKLDLENKTINIPLDYYFIM